MRKVTKSIIALVATLSLGVALFSIPAHAVDVLNAGCSSGGGGTVCDAAGSGTDTLDTLWQNITQILLYLIGIIAVIMIIIGAIKYVTANGDQSQLTSAKNTILYSIVGLILAIAAGPIIGFVLSYF